MSQTPDTKRYIKIIKPDKNITQMRFEEQKKEKNLLSKSRQNLHSKSKPSSSNTKSYLKFKNLKDEICQILSSAKSAKQKINRGLQFVKLVDNFNQEQRCLEHNNIITLYCMHDKKLLCVYCIYGVNKHRAHKLLPPLQHLEYITNDVFELQKNFNEFLYSLEDVVSNSKLTSEIYQNIMKKYMGEIQVEYVKRKLELQQMYESEKKYVTKICEELIENSKLISNEYEEIKFNIWECQARYNLDKRLKIGNPNQKQFEFIQKQMNKKNIKVKQNKKNEDLKSSARQGKSIGRENSKKQGQQVPLKYMPKDESKNQAYTQSQKDYREVLSKHIILSHVVDQMRKIQPIKIDEKTIEKKIFNKSMLKLIFQTDKNPYKDKLKSNIFTSKN